MHKCGTEKQTEGTKTENLMDTVRIYKARKIKAFKILVQFRLWCWLTHGGVSMSPRCEKSAEAYGTFCRVLNKKNRKCTKKSLNVVQIHASPYENFSKCLLNLMRTYEHLSKLPRCDSNLARSTYASCTSIVGKAVHVSEQLDWNCQYANKILLKILQGMPKDANCENYPTKWLMTINTIRNRTF